MSIKLPKETIEELDQLVTLLQKEDANERDRAMNLLEEFERSGKIPLSVLLELASDENPALSMYAIPALGRNRGSEAVKKLIELGEGARNGNPLFLELIVDALGTAGSKEATAFLLGLIGIQMGLKNKLLKSFTRGPKEEEAEAAERLKRHMELPVIRALEKIGDNRAAMMLGDYLNHKDPLVRWHAIQNMVNGEVQEFNERLKEMAANDESDLVRESADIAVGRLMPLPPEMNN